MSGCLPTSKVFWHHGEKRLSCSLHQHVGQISRPRTRDLVLNSVCSAGLHCLLYWDGLTVTLEMITLLSPSRSSWPLQVLCVSVDGLGSAVDFQKTVGWACGRASPSAGRAAGKPASSTSGHFSQPGFAAVAPGESPLLFSSLHTGLFLMLFSVGRPLCSSVWCGP